MMDNLGVAMNATTVEAYALSKGLDFTWASASNAEKAEVAMQMFFENTQQYRITSYNVCYTKLLRQSCSVMI